MLSVSSSGVLTGESCPVTLKQFDNIVCIARFLLLDTCTCTGYSATNIACSAVACFSGSPPESRCSFVDSVYSLPVMDSVGVDAAVP